MTEPFRLLTVGCFDAAIEQWVHGQINGTATMRIDGVELSRDAIRRARDRFAKAGIAAEFKRGAAADAPRLFPPGEYDAVVSYELIEHVPSMPDFLDTLEAMVKPGGRVYLSTPDGTFGLGNNPHHLRAMRAMDLADLLRRRGELMDMIVGDDGVTVASYVPQPRREDVAIYLGPCWNTWSPFDIATKGLGGSETAAVRLAEALSQLGFIVTVYGDTPEMCVRQVIYRRHEVFDPMDTRGALICSRIPDIGDRTIDGPLAAAVRLLWSHDIDFADRLTPARASRFDHILGLSGWHVKHLQGRYPFAAVKVVQARNGLALDDFEPKPWKERAQRVVYSSSPDRGLDVLLGIWPQIRDMVPDATLAFCYPDVYDAVADQDPAVAAHRAQLDKTLAGLPGVERRGSLPQPDLHALMCDSRVWAHPSWMGQHDAPFHETSCIGSMEAQAAGCAVVASGWGALGETVKVGKLVNGVGGSDKWKLGLVTGIIEGLTDPATGNAAVARGPIAARDLGWPGVAEQIAGLITAGTPVR